MNKQKTREIILIFNIYSLPVLTLFHHQKNANFSIMCSKCGYDTKAITKNEARNLALNKRCFLIFKYYFVHFKNGDDH